MPIPGDTFLYDHSTGEERNVEEAARLLTRWMLSSRETFREFVQEYQNQPPTREPNMPRPQFGVNVPSQVRTGNEAYITWALDPDSPPQTRHYWFASTARRCWVSVPTADRAHVWTSVPREPAVSWREYRSTHRGNPVQRPYSRMTHGYISAEVPTEMEVSRVNLNALVLPRGQATWMDTPGVKPITDAEVRVFSEDHRLHRNYLAGWFLWCNVSWRTNNRRFNRTYSLEWTEAIDFMDMLCSRLIQWYMFPARELNYSRYPFERSTICPTQRQ